MLIEKKVLKNGDHLSCDLHKIGANLNSKLPVAPFLSKKYGPGWMDGWVDGRVGGKAGLRIVYSNQKFSFQWSGKKFRCDDSDCPFGDGMIQVCQNLFNLFLKFFLKFVS